MKREKIAPIKVFAVFDAPWGAQRQYTRHGKQPASIAYNGTS
jgi:hypothetical protein